MDRVNNNKKKVLIAFLGRASYQDTLYTIEGCSYKEKLAFKAIYKHFSPFEKTYIIGTEESSWSQLNDQPHIPIYIPYGKKVEEFWEIFDILKNNIDVKDSQVIFDFTHGFRVLPLFGAIFVRLLQYIEPTAVLSHVFYGSYEPNQNVTPIVDLSPFVDLLDWIDAVNEFTKYGELGAFASKVGREYNRAYKENFSKKPKVIGSFYKKLDKISKILNLTYTPLIFPESRELSHIIESEALQDETNFFIKPLGLLLPKLKAFTNQFEKESIWESHLSVARFYSENNRLTQSLLVLREAIISYLCEKNCRDLYDIETREEIASNLNSKCKDSDEPIYKLWNKTRELRNDVGHAFMKLKGHDTKPQRIAEKVKKLIEEAENVLRKET